MQNLKGAKMERDKLGRRIVGIDDGYKNFKEAHEAKMKRMGYEDYQATKARRIGGKWSNIISHMDALWHGEEGPDGCSKCTRYEEILYNAFDHINELSNRNLNDMATMHRDDMVKDVDEEKLKEEWREQEMYVEHGQSLIESREEVEDENIKLERKIRELESKVISLEEENAHLKVDTRVTSEDVESMVKNILNMKGR